jgi:uncharacterized protein YgiM (DUF1202 family)
VRRLLPLLLVLLLLAAACAAPAPTPTTVPEPPPPVAPPSTPNESVAAIGTVRVTSATLNVRREPATTGEVVAQVKKGERLALLAHRGEWSNVRLADGITGWVSSKLVANDASGAAAGAAKPRRGSCADSDFRFVQAPLPSFNNDQTAHGIVTVDANVDTRGIVTSTKVVSNTTGDAALAALAEKEIRNAKFAPPMRNCVAKAFIYTYKRSF